MTNAWALVLFTLLILVLLALDLGVLNRRPHMPSFREAALTYAGWLALASLFGVGVYYWRGFEPALQFVTGYVLELSLSMDNVFVFAVIFRYVAVPLAYQHRVLFWGILGALVMRGLFIGAGVALVSRFTWVFYLFGAFLVFTGLKLLLEKHREFHPERNPLLGLTRRFFPVTSDYAGASFLVRRAGVLMLTPLLLVLIMVESADVLFAVDSIPAVFAITQDPFIVYTSNVFAILGLRTLYFLLAGAIAKFRYLHPALAVILVLVGLKMLLAHFYRLPTWLSLAVICLIFGIAILLSLLRGKSSAAEEASGEV